MVEPLSNFALVVHCALFASILGLELYRNRARRFDYLTLFSAAYLLNYAVVPLVYDAAGYSILAVQGGGLKQPAPFELDAAAVDIFLGYCVFAAGYYFGCEILAPRKSPIIFGASVRKVALVLAIAGVASFSLYALAYGGVLGLLKIAPLLREGRKLAQTALVSANKFMGLTAFGLWAAAAGLLERITPLRMAQVALFGVVAMLAAMATAGRTPALVYFVPVLLLWPTRGKARIPIITTAVITVALVAWVDWAKTIADQLAGFHVGWEARGGVGLKFLEDFYPTYASVPAALGAYDSTGAMFGLNDFGSALVHMLPQHLLGLTTTVYSSKNLNTLLVGAFGGGRPPGLIGWSIYSLGPGWFLLWPLFYGVLAGALQSRYAPGREGAPFAFCVYMGIGAQVSYALVFDTDPTVYANDSVWLVLGVLLIEFFGRLDKRSGTFCPPDPASARQSLA